jgi:hypothetical protein
VHQAPASPALAVDVQGLAGKIQLLAELRDSGALSEEEFAKAKTKLIDSY